MRRDDGLAAKRLEHAPSEEGVVVRHAEGVGPLAARAHRAGVWNPSMLTDASGLPGLSHGEFTRELRLAGAVDAVDGHEGALARLDGPGVVEQAGEDVARVLVSVRC